jgi:O-antigen/teichoic acid export membrane protein
VLSLGVGPAITYYGARRPRLRPRLLAIGLLHTLVIGVLALTLAFAIGDRVLAWKGQEPSTTLVILTALVVPASFLQVVSLSMLNATRSYRSVNVLNVAARIATFLMTLIVVVALGWGVAGGLTVLLTLSLAFVLGSIPELRGIGVARPARSLVGAVAHYGGRVQIANIIRLAAGRLDVLLLAWLTGLGTVGVYAVALLVGEVVLQIPRSLGFVVMPLITAGRSGSHDLAARAMRLNGTATLAAVVIAALAGPFLIVLAFGDDFAGAVAPFLLLLPGLWFTSTANLAAFVCSARGRPGLTSTLAAVDAIATVVFDVALIPFFGSTGAAVASSLAGVAFGVLSLLAVSALIGIPRHSLLVLRRSELRAYRAEAMARLRRR